MGRVAAAKIKGSLWPMEKYGTSEQIQEIKNNNTVNADSVLLISRNVAKFRTLLA